MVNAIRNLKAVKILRKAQFKCIKTWHKAQGKEIIHFLHIGKTAGTSIKNAFGRKRLFKTKNMIIIFHEHGSKLFHIPKGEKVFFVVRDPISRYVSGFYSRKRQGLPRIFNPWSEEEKRAFELFDTPNMMAEALSSADTKLKKAAEDAFKSIGHVRSSYWDWFKNEDYLNNRLADVAFVCQQESLSEDFHLFLSTFKLPSKIQLPTDKTKTHKNPEHFDKTISPLGEENLKIWYKKEYTFLQTLHQNKLISKSYS